MQRPTGRSRRSPHDVAHFSDTEGRGELDTFPATSPHSGPTRELRRTNAFHSRVPKTFTNMWQSSDEDEIDESSQEALPERSTRRRRTAGVRGDRYGWDEGRSTSDDRTAADDRRRDRYHPYKDPRSRSPNGRHRERRPKPRSRSHRPNHYRDDRGDDEEPDAPANHRGKLPGERPKETALAYMREVFLTLPEEEKVRFVEQSRAHLHQPPPPGANETKAEGNGIAEKVIGLVQVPVPVEAPPNPDVVAQRDEALDSMEGALERLDRLSKAKLSPEEQMGGVDWVKPILGKLNGQAMSQHFNAWNASEKGCKEALATLVEKGKARSEELKTKAAAEVEKIKAAEMEKARLVSVARKDFEKIVSEEAAEIGLLQARLKGQSEEFSKQAAALPDGKDIERMAFEAVKKKLNGHRKGSGG